ncbi:Thioredoxin-like [Apibacter mensalis]|uniref:Thioredoxin-like n=1 Tax=Apibacter mensalis TaxID=1586267 RepID=A0A0X3ANW0_9FLAO|nr:thioredoxin family protein [Apibacter mensalis]CVK16042.1 Thioredoxin-like [Apibacter mensalis]
MKKNLTVLFFSLFVLLVYSQQVPPISKTEFSEEPLKQVVLDTENNEITMQSVLNKHKGKITVIRFWASWCRDCILEMTDSHVLKEKNKKVDFIYLSLDKNFDAWKKGITKYELNSGDNYWFSVGWKNPFNEYIELNWIPRYMVIDQKGKIANYYAVSAKDIEIQNTINKLLEK